MRSRIGMSSESRAYDPLYDPVYTVSSATDHYHEQSRGGAFAVQQRPDYKNFYSVLPHYQCTSFCVNGNDHLPFYVSREYRQNIHDPQWLQAMSSKAAVSGSSRWKHSQRPFLASTAPVVIVQTTCPAHYHEDVAIDGAMAACAERTVGTQSDFRESEAQTGPYSPEAKVVYSHEVKQLAHIERFHCSGLPELMHLENLHFHLGQWPGVDEVEHVYKLRAKRAFEASLPPISNPALLNVRQAMMEQWENQEWKAREQEIQSHQQERLKLLKEAITAREAEAEADIAERVQATTDRLLLSKQAAFEKLQQQRIKAIRRFVSRRKHIEKSRWQVNREQSIVDKYTNPGSSVYAPLQRDGAFPDSRPRGKAIATEGFVPTDPLGLRALESALPKRKMQHALKVGRVQPSTNRKNAEHRKHLDSVASTLADSRAAGLSSESIGNGLIWPAVAKGAAGKAVSQKLAPHGPKRPDTPVLELPMACLDLHKAVCLLQRLLRGRAIQAEIQSAALYHAELITELLTPLSSTQSNMQSATAAEQHKLGVLGHVIRQLLQAYAEHDPRKRRVALDQLASKCKDDSRATVPVSQPAQHAEPQEAAAVTIQAQFRGFQGRKHVAALQAQGARLQLELETAARSTVDLPATDITDLQNCRGASMAQIGAGNEAEIIVAQAGVRGNLDRKQMKERRAQHVRETTESTLLSSFAMEPELEARVVKAQAGVRGYIARKQVARMRTKNR